jgi:hypothetical protein
MATNSSVVNAIKLWIFPGLISILATSIWYDLKEIKADVKALMAQSNIDKTRIDNLERRVNNLEVSIYVKSSQQKTVILSQGASKYFIKEEELDINKYLRKRV